MSRDFLIHNGKLTSDLDADGNLIKNLPGVAHLVDGKVPSDELPSYVDDVLEYATLNDFPVTGTEGKIYVAKDTNKTYRWSGTQYTEIANPTLDNAVTKNSANGVKSSGIWSAIWGALSALPTGFSSLYDWVVAQLGLKRDYTDLSYDTTETVEVPALHVTMRDHLSWQVIAEYDFLCTEEVPDPPQMGHVYTWRADGAAFYITQGVSALQTTWILYSQNGEVIEVITTQNATQGFYPDVDFIANAAVITTHKTTVQKQVAKEDTIALESKTVPTSRTVNGKALSSDVTLTGADIAVSGTDATKIDAALAGKASTADATLTERGFSAWTIVVSPPPGMEFEAVGQPYYENGRWHLEVRYRATGEEEWNYDTYDQSGDEDALHVVIGTFFDCTRTVLPGYQLGSQDGKPLASEAEAEALRTGKQNALSAQQLANIAAVSDALAFDATHTYAAGDPVVYNGTLYTFTSAHTGAWTGSDVSAVDIIARLAGKLDKSGDTMTGPLTLLDSLFIKSAPLDNGVEITTYGWIGYNSQTAVYLDSLILAYNYRGSSRFMMELANGSYAEVANTSDIPYDLVTKTISNGAVTLDDRAINAVAVSSSLASLTVNFPTATSGKARDFGLRLTVASGITTAPELALPQGVTCENADGEAPEIGADGAATILYFTETASGVFLVKGEVVTAIS